jgi:hypothetical protein
MAEPVLTRVRLADIFLDEDRIQVRVSIDEKTVEKYAEAMRLIKEDSTLPKFPPPHVFKGEGIPDGAYLLSAGYHRYHAMGLTGDEWADVLVFDGTPEDAFIHGAEDNKNNAKELTEEDELKIVRGLFLNPKTQNWSPERKGKVFGRSRNTVTRRLATLRNRDPQFAANLSNGQVGESIVYTRDGVEQVMRKGGLGKPGAGKASLLLPAIRFVVGAVAEKDYVPSLQCLNVANGRVTAYNGAVSMSGPIDPTLPACRPNYEQFKKALRNIGEPVASRLLDSNRLELRRGTSLRLVDCIEEGWPEVLPEGGLVELHGDLLDTLRPLEPFISRDATLSWQRGVLLKGDRAYATTGFVLVERRLPKFFPVTINIPEYAVHQLLKAGEPTHVQVAKDSATFHFPGERWLKTSLLPTSWPDVSQVLVSTETCSDLPDGFFDALKNLRNDFAKDRCAYLRSGYIATTEERALEEVPGVEESWGCYNADALLKLRTVARYFDLSRYPDPCPFTDGDRLRGVIVGMNEKEQRSLMSDFEMPPPPPPIPRHHLDALAEYLDLPRPPQGRPLEIDEGQAERLIDQLSWFDPPVVGSTILGIK